MKRGGGLTKCGLSCSEFWYTNLWTTKLCTKVVSLFSFRIAYCLDKMIIKQNIISNRIKRPEFQKKFLYLQK